MNPTTNSYVPAILAALLLVVGCGGEETNATMETEWQFSAELANPVETETGLQYEDLQEGSGAEAAAGMSVTVHYTGWLTDGTMFDSSKNGGQPFQFRVGVGQVISGWDQGVAGMKVGGIRRLVIPADLGYGARGAGGAIPPNATLVFTVELLTVADN